MSYPTDPEFQAISIVLEYNNLRSEARSGRTQVRNVGSARWSFTAKYNDLTRDQFAPVMAFLASKRGGEDAFDITPPVVSSTRGDASGSATVNGANNAGDRSISVQGFSGSLKAGDFIKFANHTKVYMVTNDVVSGGDAIIEPALYSSVADNEAITYTSVPFRMRVARDIQQVKFVGYDRFQFEIDLIEAI